MTEYRIYCEGVCTPDYTHTDGLYELIECLADSTNYTPQLVATYNNLSDAMAALADVRCTARLQKMCDRTLCLADMYYMEEVQVIDKDKDYCQLTGNRWYAQYELI